MFTLEVASVRALHALTRVALRALPPIRAQRIIQRVARVLPPLPAERAEAAVQSLGLGGSCLSRSLAVAALLPGSQVVFGGDFADAARFRAHAWVELDGASIGATSGADFQRIAGVGGRR